MNLRILGAFQDILRILRAVKLGLGLELRKLGSSGYPEKPSVSSGL